MKLSELTGLDTPREEWPLPYPASLLADPPITEAEAQAVDLGCDTTCCRRHRGEFTHLNVDGKVYLCAVGRMYFRHTKPLSEFLKPLRYR
jgi:hypothetical protein